jgi:hypothetical protein
MRQVQKKATTKATSSKSNIVFGETGGVQILRKSFGPIQWDEVMHFPAITADCKTELHDGAYLAAKRAIQKRYDKRYDKGEKGVARREKYEQSGKGKAKARRNRQSEKGKATQQRYLERQKSKTFQCGSVCKQAFTTRGSLNRHIENKAGGCYNACYAE